MTFEVQYAPETDGPWSDFGLHPAAPDWRSFESSFVEAQGGVLPGGYYRLRPAGSEQGWALYRWAGQLIRVYWG